MTAFQKIAGGIALAMVITAIVLPGRSTQETAVLGGLTNLGQGVIAESEGRNP